MSDIFDEVDKILDEAGLGTEEVTTAESESNFNESELQDIMNEIESLEKDFDPAPTPVTTSAPAADLYVTPAAKTSLQEEIEREIAMSMEVSSEVKEDIVVPVTNETPITETVTEPKVLSFEKKSASTSTPVSTTPATYSKSSSEISFEACGSMNLNLGFKVGEETAKLSIDPVKGLVVTMNGVELCINQEEGCKVTMENGVKFTIPLTTSESASKKKSA